MTRGRFLNHPYGQGRIFSVGTGLPDGPLLAIFFTQIAQLQNNFSVAPYQALGPLAAGMGVYIVIVERVKRTTIRP